MGAWSRAKRMASWWLAVWVGLVGVLGLGVWLGGSAAAAQGGGFQGQSVDWAGSQTVSVASLKISQKAWEHFSKANAAAGANRVEEFERETAKALAIEPKFAEVYLLRARWSVTTGKFDEAVADVVEAQKIQPGVTWAGVILAQAYNGARRFHDAVVVLENLHGPEADAWQVKYERSRAALGLHDTEGGLHWSEAALQMAPASCIEVHLLRANALLAVQRWGAAARELETYLAANEPQTKRAQVIAALAATREMESGGNTAEMTLASR